MLQWVCHLINSELLDVRQRRSNSLLGIIRAPGLTPAGDLKVVLLVAKGDIFYLSKYELLIPKRQITTCFSLTLWLCGHGQGMGLQTRLIVVWCGFHFHIRQETNFKQVLQTNAEFYNCSMAAIERLNCWCIHSHILSCMVIVSRFELPLCVIVPPGCVMSCFF